MTTPTDDAPKGELLLYQTEDGRARIECRFEGETVWLTQAQMAELFQTTPQNITQHLREIYAEGELNESATCKSYLQVRTEGARQVSRNLRFYSLEAILAVGFRVRSHRGTQFRKWANARLSEFLVKGFTMDDERLKNPPGPGHIDYFDELLERIRDIRASERRFYQKVLDIYATSIDYQPDTELSQQLFATVQNKMHWATHGHTAAEIVHERADGEKLSHRCRPRRLAQSALEVRQGSAGEGEESAAAPPHHRARGPSAGTRWPTAKSHCSSPAESRPTCWWWPLTTHVAHRRGRQAAEPSRRRPVRRSLGRTARRCTPSGKPRGGAPVSRPCQNAGPPLPGPVISTFARIAARG